MGVDRRRGNYWVPGDSRTYVLPHDIDALDAAWDAYLGSKPEPLPVEAERERAEPQPMDPERKRRHEEAVAYIRDYTGTWGLVLDLRANQKWGTKWFRLSDRQVEVLLQAKERDAQRAEENKRRLQTGLDLTALPAGTTRYAVENADGELTFMKVDHVDNGKWAGWVFVKQVVGGGSAGYDNEQKLGSQRPGDAYRGSFERLLRKVLDNPVEAAIRYGMELGQCSACGRTLTNAESRANGIGPECASRYAA